MFGGFIHGTAQEAWLQPWETVVAVVRPYAAVATFAWCVILFANVFFFLHLALMWLRLDRFCPAFTKQDEDIEAETATH